MHHPALTAAAVEIRSQPWRASAPPSPASLIKVPISSLTCQQTAVRWHWLVGWLRQTTHGCKVLPARRTPYLTLERETKKLGLHNITNPFDKRVECWEAGMTPDKSLIMRCLFALGSWFSSHVEPREWPDYADGENKKESLFTFRQHGFYWEKKKRNSASHISLRDLVGSLRHVKKRVFAGFQLYFLKSIMAFAAGWTHFNLKPAISGGRIQPLSFELFCAWWKLSLCCRLELKKI